MRLSAAVAVRRRDVIIVASVSCIYGLGSPGLYGMLHRSKRPTRPRQIRQARQIQYRRNDRLRPRYLPVRGVSSSPGLRRAGLRIELFGTMSTSRFVIH
jgi:excinuclease ABC subunit B